MFDIGFSELMLIGIVALIVIGPERLPKVARTVGAWLGRINRYVTDIKHGVERDIKLEEFRKLQLEMHEHAVNGMGYAEGAAQRATIEIDHLGQMMHGMSPTDYNQATYFAEEASGEIDSLVTTSGGSTSANAVAAITTNIVPNPRVGLPPNETN